MVVQVQKTGNVFTFELSPDAMAELQLEDGTSIEIRLPEAGDAPTTRYASAEEVMQMHRKLEPRHAEAYRELAK